MKKVKFVSLVVIVLYFLSSACMPDYAKGDIIPEGTEIGAHYDVRQKINCYADDKYFYLKMSTRDSEYQMQIMIYGLILEIIQSDTNQKEIRIDYPLIKEVPPPERGIAQMFRNNENEGVMKNITNERLREMRVYRKNKSGQMISIDREKLIIARIKSEPHGLMYDVKIPLSMIKKKDTDYKKYYTVSLKTPKIDLLKIREKYGVSREEVIDKKMPIGKNMSKENIINLKNVEVKVPCLL